MLGFGDDIHILQVMYTRMYRCTAAQQAACPSVNVLAGTGGQTEASNAHARYYVTSYCDQRANILFCRRLRNCIIHDRHSRPMRISTATQTREMSACYWETQTHSSFWRWHLLTSRPWSLIVGPKP